MHRLAILLLLSGCYGGYGSQWSDTPLIDDDDTPVVLPPGGCGEEAPEGADGDPDDPEVCNGRDDDCDGLVDELDPDLTDGIEVHPDADGDTYGDPTITLLVCELGDGQTLDDQDCDDADPEAYPGAVESWGDGADSDCDGDPDPDPCESAPIGVDVQADQTCEVEPVLGWFNPGVAWSLDAATLPPELDGGSTNSPMVGHLLDDDGDGVVDGPGDLPEIALVVGWDPHIALVRGDGGEVTVLPHPPHPDGFLWPNYQADLALGDVDGDGVPEIAATWEEKTLDTDDPCHPGVQEVDGTMRWFRQDVDFNCGHHAPALADLDGNGTVEAIWGDHVFDGATGATVWIGGAGQGTDPDYLNSGFHSFAADVDADGTLEVVAGRTIYTAGGAVHCALSDADGYPSVANLDADPGLEIVLTGHGLVRIYDDDCQELVSRDVVNGGWGGPSTIADLDGDGALEIGVAGETSYTAYEADGTPLWSAPITDISSSSTSSIAFDFDGDGAWEIVYGDEHDLWVFDGRDGTALVQDPWRGSGTRNEQPVVADIDGDGSAEILVSNDEGSTPLYVLDDAFDRWVGARPTWNQHAFHPSGISDALEVLAPSPTGPDGFRVTTPIGAAPTLEPLPVPAADLRIEIWGTCEPLPGAATYWWQVVNEGAAAAPAETRVHIDVEDDFAGRLLMFDEALGEPLEPGGEGLIYSGAVIEPTLGAYDRVVFEADSDGIVPECDETNNIAILNLPD
jgi:hypothetical protein